MSIHPLLSVDGTEPAPGTTSLNVSRLVHPPLKGDPMRRDPLTLAACINQFAVAVNPRYEVRDTSGDGRKDTHCDAFAADVCDALGVVLPQWVAPDGTPQQPGHGRELNANGMADWLEAHGARFGWRKVRAKLEEVTPTLMGPWIRAEAQRLANLGHPTLVAWKSPSGPGHIAVVRPAELREDGPIIAQAGARRFNRGTLAQGFGEGKLLAYWVNDTGGVITQTAGWAPPAALVEQALADLNGATPEELRLAAQLFTTLTARQGTRSAVSGVKLPSFDGCSPLVRADWLDVARFVMAVMRTTELVQQGRGLEDAAAQACREVSSTRSGT